MTFEFVKKWSRADRRRESQYQTDHEPILYLVFCDVISRFEPELPFSGCNSDMTVRPLLIVT
jgi:hypothetical protein